MVDADNAPALAYVERHGYPVDTPSPARQGRPTAMATERQDVDAATDIAAVAAPRPEPEG